LDIRYNVEFWTFTLKVQHLEIQDTRLIDIQL
jgi:hypothetical protein